MVASLLVFAVVVKHFSLQIRRLFFYQIQKIRWRNDGQTRFFFGISPCFASHIAAALRRVVVFRKALRVFINGYRPRNFLAERGENQLQWRHVVAQILTVKSFDLLVY